VIWSLNKNMGNDIKIFIGIIGFTVLMIVGLAFWQGGKEDVPSSNTQSLGQVAGVQVNPENYDLGNVPINGGLVTKEYELKNDTESTIKLGNVVTSCMCTQAKVTIGDKESRFFGMEHPGDRNPSLGYEINPGEKALVTVNFDPAAHGPQGIGPFDRVVEITFNDPSGVKKLTFSGTVVK
jgi:hypothetical protein